MARANPHYIPGQSLQLVAGKTAQEFNSCKEHRRWGQESSNR